MAAVGGSVQSVTMAGRTFSVATDADVGFKLGGFENATEANGDGTARLLKTRVPWALTDATLSIDDTNGDLEFLQNLANQNDFFAITITKASGEIYQGNGQIEGEVIAQSATTTAPVSMMGTATLTKQ